MNILLVEDELHTANLLQEIIEQDVDFMVVEKTQSIIETVEYLNKYQHNIDLLFFDIQLADGKSFEIFKHIDVVKPVVFCTAYDEFTMQAIKNNGIDYVLKPFKETEIHQALNKYKNLKATLQSKDVQPLQIENPTQQSYQKTFLTQYREKSLVKRIEDVAIFYVELENVYMHTTSNEKCPLFKKMEYIESVCDPNQFFRVNRQMLVHRDAIISFEPYFNRKIVLQLNVNFKEQIIVSRLKVTAFKEWLER